MAIVYEHLRNDTNEVFYVGIGKEEGRAFDKHNRNKHWHNIVNKAGYTVNIIYKDIEYEEAKNIEILLIEKYGRKNLGLGNLVNLTDGGEGCLGLIISEEIRQKLSEVNKGKTLSDKTKKKISESLKGKTHTEKSKQKISEAQKGKPKSEEHRQKMSEARKNMSEDARQKMSEAQKGKTLSDKTKKKISESLKGKTHTEKSKQKISEARKNMSEETRQKMSEAQKGKTLSEETKQKMSERAKNRKDVKGYSFNNQNGKYSSRIKVRDKKITLGSFDTPGEAAEAYQKAKLIYHV